METNFTLDAGLTTPDKLVLERLLQDVRESEDLSAAHLEVKKRSQASNNDRQDSGVSTPIAAACGFPEVESSLSHESTLQVLHNLNNPKHSDFDPTVFVLWDTGVVREKLPWLFKNVVEPYTQWAKNIVRVETDVVMVTHLLMYFTTTVPSAAYLFYHFTYPHAVLHLMMQFYYIGTYNLMMHQHIHMRGLLKKRYRWFDLSFPLLLDPLFGHTWNSYYYHHVKHHHVEANGPNDLSSTIRYQRDSVFHFLHYFGRFFLFIWFDLPHYFFRKGNVTAALSAGLSEFATFFAVYNLASWNFRAALFTIIIEFCTLRLGLMVGNWGQHAFVDEVEPDSDFRSSITLIDVASNRFCFNDGYHTSHHLNPLRHWRQHPVAFLKQKEQYAAEHALVFKDIDYIMITVRLLMKDYAHLARCLVPIGDQMSLSLEERAAMLQTKTKAFSEADIARKFH